MYSFELSKLKALHNVKRGEFITNVWFLFVYTYVQKDQQSFNFANGGPELLGWAILVQKNSSLSANAGIKE